VNPSLVGFVYYLQMTKPASRHFPALLPILCLAAVLPAPSRAQAPPAATFKNEVHLVDFTYSVRRADGTLAKGLTRDDFQVTEDGVPQKIAFFGKEADLPLTLGLLVDASDSQSHFFKRHRKDIEKFLDSVLHPGDQVFTICFGNHLRLTNDLTATPAAVLDGLERFDKGDRNFPELASDDEREGGTALYDAIFHGIGNRIAQSQGRRALILFTDGEENSSAHDLLDAIDAARDTDTLIYAIRYTDHKELRTPHARQGVAALHHLGLETGGADYDALHSDLSEVFKQIADELRSLYSIGYHSTNRQPDSTFRRVRITTADPSLIVHARTGYYAR
jgi:Ca-activated chloride channel homolog